MTSHLTVLFSLLTVKTGCGKHDGKYKKLELMMPIVFCEILCAQLKLIMMDIFAFE